ncbi:MAG: 50S ribosomal protein L19 [Clostridia bacterium]|jgi:large subunit ribosomal protein L19|nr:50S ribosomal protein L19 [Clostridia bacterium]
MDIIKSIEHEQLKNSIPDIKIGNTIRVHVKIKEGNKERIQVFEGIVIKKQGGGVNETFTVRKISYGVGVEKTFLIHSPLVEKVEVVRVGKARRAKLYYLRERTGKASKTKEMVGARIENKEIIIKEELKEEPVEEVVEKVEQPAVEEVKETSKEVEKTAEVVNKEVAPSEPVPEVATETAEKTAEVVEAEVKPEEKVEE